MTKARTLADMISDGVIGTTELADDVITPVKLDETGSYVVSTMTVNGGSGAVTLAANSDIRATTGTWTGEHSGKIQYHNNEWYFQFADKMIGRNGSAVNVFTVDNTGKGYFADDVSIGTTTANEKLSVSGNIELYNDEQDGYIWFHDAGTRSWTLGSQQSSGNFVLTNTVNIGSNEKLVVNSSGNVGINENSPDTKLHVSNSTPQTPIITVENSSVNEATIRFKTNHSADSDFRVGASISASNNFEIYSVNAATSRLAIDSSGLVGIGTTSPATKVDINNGTSNSLLTLTTNSFNGASRTGINFQVNGFANTPSGQIAVVGDNNYSGDMLFSLANSGTTNPLAERMRITSSGNIGIGTGGSPSTNNGVVTKLVEIQSTSNNCITGTTDTAGMNGLLLEARHSGRSPQPRYAQIEMPCDSSGNGSIAFHTAASAGYVIESMKIDDNGRVTKARQPCFEVYNGGSDFTVSGNVKITCFSYERFDVGGVYNASNQRFTAPVSGKYLFGMHLRMGVQGKVRVFRVELRINGSANTDLASIGGTNEYYSGDAAGTGDDHPGCSGTTLLNLSAGDYIELYTASELQSSGTLRIQNGFRSHWWGMLVS